MDKKKFAVPVMVLTAALLLLTVILLMRGAVTDTEPEPALTRLEDGAIVLTPEPQNIAVPTVGTESAPAAARPEGDPTVPVRLPRAGADYFSDAAFVGDETVASLGRYDYDGLLAEAVFYEVGSVTESGYVNKIKKDGGYGKIYFGLGGNEMANRVDSVRDSLEAAVRALQAEYPGCIIYLMEITPVSEYRSGVSRSIQMERTGEYNEMLYELAVQLGVWYLPVTEALVNEEGYLPSEVTEDGINFTPAHYEAWYEILASRTIGGS